MPITTFGALKAAVAARAVRTDLDALIPDFCRAAHDVIAGRLALTVEIGVGASPAALPSDFRRALSVWLEGYPAQPLTLATEAQMAGLGSGRPLYYRVDGASLVFAPTADAAYAGRLLYKPARDFFAEDAASNTALLRYPSLYLYGAMAELSAHTRNAEERERYLALFLAGIEAANAAELDDLTAAATLQPQTFGAV